MAKKNLILIIVALVIIMILMKGNFNIGTEAVVGDNCIDSDGGLDYLTLGGTTTNTFGFTSDRCASFGFLEERFCLDDGFARVVSVRCPNGECSNGACQSALTSCSYNQFDPCESCAEYERTYFEFDGGICSQSILDDCIDDLPPSYTINGASCDPNLPEECAVTSGSECNSCTVTTDVLNNPSRCGSSVSNNCLQNLENIVNSEWRMIMGSTGSYFCQTPNCPITQDAECNTCEATVEVMNKRADNECGTFLTNDCISYLQSNFPTEHVAIDSDAQGNFFCESCQSRDTSRCFGNDVWWFDSCGTREEIKEVCDSGCGGGVCTSCNTDADSNCDGSVSNSELISYIGDWTNNQVSNTELLNSIGAWSQS